LARVLGRAVLTLLSCAVGAGPHTAAADGSKAAPRRAANSEYHFTQTRSAWEAFNRAQSLRIGFTDRGVRVMPQATSAPAWHLGLAVAGHPTGTTAIEGAAARIDVAGLRGEFVNGPDGLELRFTLLRPLAGAAAPAARLDLELDATLLALPAADGRRVDFALPDGTRVARLGAVWAQDARGDALALRVEVSTAPGFPALQLVLGDETPVYPVTLGALVSSSGWFAEGNQSASGFGAQVFAAGDVNGDGHGDLIVGAPRYDNGQSNEGRVYVYHGTAGGPSSVPAWQAESDQVEGRFGTVVGPAGDVNGDGFADVLVGEPLRDAGQVDEGRVCVYLGSAAGLQATPAWVAEGNQAGARFGLAVAALGSVDGDAYADILVGAPLYDNGQKDEGRVFLYRGSAAGLAAAPTWTAESNQVGARFGSAVGAAGDVNADGFADAIVGAFYHDNGQKDEGRAYVYRGSASGVLVQIWAAEGDQNHARFGSAVATAGDVNGDGYADVAVAAALYDGGQQDEGRVFVYFGSLSGPAATPAWTAEGNQADAGFGSALAPAGDVNGDGYGDLLVGAPGFDFGQTDEGRSFLYHGSASGLAPSPAWTAEGNQTSGRFAGAVAPAGDVNGDGYSDLLVGSETYDGDLIDEGRVTVFYGGAAGLTTVPKWSFEGNECDAELGWALDGAGDVNGDGYDDVMVAAFKWDSNAPCHDVEVAACDNPAGPLCDRAGKVWVFHGGPGGPDAVPDWSARGGQLVPGHANTNDTLGFGVGRAGDVNGDGYDDVLLGCPQCEGVPEKFGQVNEGWALLYYGSPGGLSAVPGWIGESNQAFSGYGREVAGIGDVNADGYDDIAVGASLWDASVPEPPAPCPCPPGGFSVPHALAQGKVFVYYGSPTGPGATPDWTVIGDQPDALFGKEIGAAGDVNGDGFADMIFSATDYSVVYPPNGTTTGKGRVFVYHGSAAGLGTTPSWSAEATPNAQGNSQLDSHFGYGCRGAGDVNGDGYSDVIVGAPDYDDPELIEGRLYLYAGSATGLSAAPSWSVAGNQTGAYLGIDVQGVGDVSGDGYADVIAGSDGWGKVPPLGNDPMNNVGRVWFFAGSPAGLLQAPAGFFESGQAYAQAGVNVAAAGDVNGDGYADILFGSRRWDDAGDPPSCNAPGTPAGVSCPFKDEGKTWILMGNQGTGLAVVPQQRRVDDAGQIGQGLVADSSNSFRISLLARAPFGRTRVKLEWEVKPEALPFDGTGTQRGTQWTDTGPAGVTLSEPVTGLAPNTAYHWRVRVRLDPAMTPFQHAGRWIAPPRNGAREADLYTAP